ncbi:thioredoxin [Mesoplasma corruscae]|uniref:Thioredoxin n=1 Tax=Mesoplasma corruscae TaxID=216874 RepID=A0A2S5RGR0_9MOLU|nr:thioredoxin [Mesoplasma corruscae]PPE06493.1 thioredoxin [Mesoplasma corruscae]
MAELIKIKTVEEFDELVATGKTLVDFNAVWCGPCKMQMPIVDLVAKRTQGVKFVDLDVDVVPDIAKRYEVMSIPTLMIFENGEAKNKNVGFMDPAKLEAFIK